MSATIGAGLERIPHNLPAEDTLRLYHERQTRVLELEASLANPQLQNAETVLVATDLGQGPNLLPGQLWTFEEICLRLRICKRILNRLIQRGEIRSTHITPKVVCFQPAEVERFLASRTQAPQLAPCPGMPQLVSLDQLAAVVHVSKRSLDRHSSKIPGRLCQGSRGRPSLWDWTIARVWLEQRFGLLLPERFPGLGDWAEE